MIFIRRMRVPNDLLNCVVFFGHGESEHFKACGTGFILLHDRMIYLVTAGHVAEGLANDPFSIRVNRPGGSHGIFPVDLETLDEPRCRWFEHPETSVDLAVLPFPVDMPSQGIEAVALKSSAVVEQKNPMEDAGCGDMCHVIGLFSMRSGIQRNTAVVHTGHIAALSDSKELIPSSFRPGHTTMVEGHLVEVSNLPGLSGAPVFVRGGFELSLPTDPEGDALIAVAHKPELKLLGVWQGSWDRNLVDTGQRAPVGMGVVTPAYRLIQLLDSEAVAKNREDWFPAPSATQNG